MRVINFLDTFESESAPTVGVIPAGALQGYASDAAYVTAKGSAAAAGDAYFNTTDNIARVHNGTSWNYILDESYFASLGYDRIVGASPVATDADLATAISNASNGDSILVLDAEDLATTVTISLDDLRVQFMPGATLTDDGAGTGIDITGDRVRILEARMIDFTTAISIDAAASFTRVQDSNFNNVTTDVDDSGTNSILQGNITE